MHKISEASQFLKLRDNGTRRYNRIIVYIQKIIGMKQRYLEWMDWEGQINYLPKKTKKESLEIGLSYSILENQAQ